MKRFPHILVVGVLASCFFMSCSTVPGGNPKSGNALRGFQGLPDTSFGTDGVVRWDSGLGNETVHSVSLQPDGKIVVSGTIRMMDPATRAWKGDQKALLMLNPDGGLDMAFGTDGVSRWDDSSGKMNGGDIAVLSGGKILLAGSYTVEELKRSVIKSDLLLARFNRDGRLDTSFGDSGVLRWNYTEGVVSSGPIHLMADGRFLIGGTVKVQTGGKISWEPFLAMFTADGKLDTGFGQNGVAGRSSDKDPDSFGNLRLLPDGRILVAGTYFSAGNPRGNVLGMIQFNPDGSPDTTFALSGTPASQTGSDSYKLANFWPLSNGKILVAGSVTTHRKDRKYPWHNRIFISRFLENGTPDADFSQNGHMEMKLTSMGGEQGNEYCKGIFIQPDGKILLIGSNSDTAGKNGGHFMVRLMPDGKVDTGFADMGILNWNANAGKGEGAGITHMTAGEDGAVLLAGTIGYGLNVTDLLLLKFR